MPCSATYQRNAACCDGGHANVLKSSEQIVVQETLFLSVVCLYRYTLILSDFCISEQLPLLVCLFRTDPMSNQRERLDDLIFA
jgi:hypothetical protein